VTPDTIAFAVRSLVRVGSAARSAYEQQVRDKDIVMADLDFPMLEGDDELSNFFFSNAELADRSKSGDLKELWTSDFQPINDEARRKLIEVQAAFIAALPPTDQFNKVEADFARGLILRQWRSGAEPPSPLMRIALALADVALDYVKSNPAVLSVGSAGEKFIGSIAGSIRDLLPDADNKSKWQGKEAALFFGERALAITFQAGLTALQSNPDVLTPQKEYQALVTTALKPLVDVFQTKPEQRPTLIEMRDAILGPVAQAAISTIQEHQSVILGSKFDTGTLLGTVTGAVLREAGKTGLAQLIAPEGLLRLHRAVLGVAVEQPQLFIKGTDAGAEATRKLVSSIAGVLKTAEPPFNAGLMTEVAASVLEVAGREAPAFLHLGEGWNELAASLIKEFAGGFADGLKADGAMAAFQKSFSAQQLLTFSEIILGQVASTPGMFAKNASPEVKALTAAVATILASRGSDLLSPSHWNALIASVTAEVARNPLRLISATAKPETQLLVRLATSVMAVAADGLANGRNASVLFGETLQQCLRIAVEAAVGKANASGRVEDLKRFVVLLNSISTEQPAQFGAREWLFLFEKHVSAVLDVGLSAQMTVTTLIAELKR
jgi:hypothetical protein